MSTILVLGGTGFVGRSVCERLQRDRPGGSIRVPTRRLGHGRAIWPLPTITLMQADVHDDTNLRQLVIGCDAVINLVAVLHGSRARFERVHVDLPRRLAAACTDAGVRRLVHVSALGAGPQAPSNYLRSKTAGEDVLRESGLDLTLLRPSVIFGAGDRFLNLFAAMQRVLPLMPLASADAQFQPVWVEDVAAAIVTALNERATIGATYECAGPRQMTLADIVRLAGRLAGCPRPVLPLPAPMARLQAALMALLPGEPLLSGDNLDSMKRPNVASGTLPGLPQLGITPTDIEGVASAMLGTTRGSRRLEPWRAQASR